jgi:hypothetical protein
VLQRIGKTVLRDLEPDDVHGALVEISATRSTRTLRDTKGALVRAVTYAQAHGKVGRNVAALVTPRLASRPAGPVRRSPSTRPWQCSRLRATII